MGRRLVGLVGFNEVASANAKQTKCKDDAMPMIEVFERLAI